MNDTKRNRLLISLLFIAAFVLNTSLIAVQRGESPAHKEFVVNEPSPRTVFSPARLTFVDDEATARLRQEKASQVLPLYTLDPKVKFAILSRSEEVFRRLSQTKEKGQEISSSEDILKTVTVLLEQFLSAGILEDVRKKERVDLGQTRVRKFDTETKTESDVEIKNLLSVSQAKEEVALVLDRQGSKDRDRRDTALQIFREVIQPNLFLDEARTKERRREAADSVAPVTEEVKKGEMIIQKGLLVTEKQQRRLVELERKMSARQTRSRIVTVGIFVFLGLGLVLLYLKQFEPKQLRSPKLIVLILTTFFVSLAVEKITLLTQGGSVFLLPGALASVLLTILWSPAVGILGALSVSIFSIPLAEFRLEIVLMILFGSLIGSFTARRIRKRLHFLRVGVAVGAVNAAVLVAFFSSQDWQIQEALALSPLGFANSFLVTGIAFFLVPLLESLFNLTTDITLLELSDLNHPLLKRMVVESPGTYHHSLVVSTLAEAACEAIGANALLARVGCYFHDIGKIARSEYFTENQNSLSVKDPHAKLTPTMSCLVIMSHVKDGIELAKKSKLKDVIIRFIPEHQGKGVIYYFYKKALDQAAPGEEVNVEDFRYPGPKPQSRETAVAMLADSVEATSRSLKEITPGSIQALVRKIINEKFIDGQLDECDLTLRDLHKIQESLVHNLMAIFHTRVSYPASESDPRHPNLFEADQFKKFH